MRRFSANGQEGEGGKDRGSSEWTWGGVQGACCLGGLQGRQDVGRVGDAVWRACHADLDVEAAAPGRRRRLVRRPTPQAARRGEQRGRAVRADRPIEDGGGVAEKKSCPVHLTRGDPASNRGMRRSACGGSARCSAWRAGAGTTSRWASRRR